MQIVAYHVTTPFRARAIARRGFFPLKSGMGSLWGDGIYLARDLETARIYEDFAFFQGKPLQRLELTVTLANPFTVAAVEVETRIVRGRIVWDAGEHIFARYDADALAAYRARGARGEERSALVREILVARGHDALLIDDSTFDSALGGNQAVVYDSALIVVTGMSEPQTPPPSIPPHGLEAIRSRVEHMARGAGCDSDSVAVARGIPGEIVLNPDVCHTALPNAGDEILECNLTDLGLVPAATRYRLLELPLAAFALVGVSPETYLLDGDEEGYETVVELADVLEAGGELDPVVICDHDGYYRRMGLSGGLVGERRLIVFDGYHRLAAHTLAGSVRVRAYELLLA